MNAARPYKAMNTPAAWTKCLARHAQGHLPMQANMPLLHERLMCSGSYRPVWEKINQRIMDHRRKTNRGVFGLNEHAENLVFAYYGANSTLLYRQWVADGKQLPLDEFVEIAVRLICNGMSGVIKDKQD